MNFTQYVIFELHNYVIIHNIFVYSLNGAEIKRSIFKNQPQTPIISKISGLVLSTTCFGGKLNLTHA